ncbi:MAG: hypothetical protein RI894_2492 [Bacteroidota bacterium]|jgi:WD40 repeat protein
MHVKLLATLTGHQSAIYAFLKTPHGYFTGGGEGYIAAWQPFASPDAQLIAQVPEAVFCLCLAQNYVLAGGIHGNLYVIDYAQKLILKNIAQHKKGLFAIFYHEKSQNLVTTGGDGRLTFWDIKTWKPLETLLLSTKNVRCMAFQESNGLLAVGDSQSNIFIIDFFTKIIIKIIQKAHLPSVFTVSFSPCGNFLLSGGRDALLKIWAIADDFSLEKTINAHNYTLNDLQYSPNQAFFATASRDKTIRIWDSKTFELVKVLDLFRFGAHKNSVNRLIWENDRVLLSVSDDRTVCVWEITEAFDAPLRNG